MPRVLFLLKIIRLGQLLSPGLMASASSTSGVPLSISLEEQGSHQTRWDLNPKLLWTLTFPTLHDFFRTVTESSINDLFIF